MMTTRLTRPIAIMLGLALALLLATSVARAEGEAGLVVDFGNGEVITYCVPFEGSDISGAQMMDQVGLNVNQFSGLVCAIDGTGCEHSGTFDSCTCECKVGSGSCTYWSFFNQRYGGSWVYAANGLHSARSKDGDLQAWKWGPGGPSSAPPPGAISFEQVCGHAPRGGESEPPTATLAPPTATQPPPTLAPTNPPATSEPPTNAPATSAPGSTPRVTIAAAASAAASPTAAASAAASGTAPGTTSPTGSPTANGTSETATASAAGSPGASPSPGRTTISPSVAPRQTITSPDSDDGDSGSNTTNLVAFGVIAGLLAAAIGVAVIRGQRS